MCRSCERGGRRCPADAPEKRRARQNAAYHAKKHTSTPRSPESGSDDAATAAGLAPLDGPVTAEMVRERVEHARSVLERADDKPSEHFEDGITPGERLTLTNANGWMVPTEYGLEAEAATRAAGAAIAARADEIAAPRLEQALKTDKELLSYGSDAFSSREEYAEHIAATAQDLTDFVQDTRSQAIGVTDSAEVARLHHEANAKVEEANKFRLEHARLQQGDSAWDRAEAKVYSDACREALAEQRPMGLPDGKMIEVDAKSQKATVKRLEKGLACYPSDWLARDGSYESSWESNGVLGPQQHNERIPLRIKSTSKRAYYCDVVTEAAWQDGQVERIHYSELLVGKQDVGCLGPGVSTAVHEYGHRAERVQPRVNDLAQAHLARRTIADGERHELEPYIVGKGRLKSGPSPDMETFERRDEGRSEWVRSDDFAERYMGKQNSSEDNSSEVFSTGMEGVFAGRFGGLRGTGRWKEDREHRDFILGTLASVK